MKVSTLLDQRRDQWHELERLTGRGVGALSRSSADDVSRFGKLYRDACADLALADAYQLPQETVDYLHRLVARSHNQLYRSRGFDLGSWGHTLFVKVPRVCFRDGCVQLAFVVFWSAFLLAAFLAYQDNDFAAAVLGEDQVRGVEDMYAEWNDRSVGQNAYMAGFYIFNNAGIGLQCFAWSVLVLPGLLTLFYNAVTLGTVFGHMFRPELGETSANFKTFVTAHGPFELTAIILSAGAGLRIGMGLIRTQGLDRLSSIANAGREATPIAGAAVVLFIFAAFIEGFISPSALPWAAKGLVALASSTLLLVYFVVLGFPRGGADDET